MVVEVESKQQLLSAINYHGLVVVDFYAHWCGPCKVIAPVLETLSDEYDDVRFLKVDVDKFKELALEYEITSMPTVLFFKEGHGEGRVVGANVPALRQVIAALA